MKANESIRPIIPGTINPLSKHGLEAINGRMENNKAGEYLRNESIS
tara:strand:+ start:279 stop:416 length:138 start_codon:yes stop_codon:yes gene_type:complete